MPLALHFDPYAGISAAAVLGALLDVGLDADALRATLAPLALPPWTLTTERATAGVAGTHATIATTGEQGALSLGAVRALLAASTLTPAVRERSVRILARVAAGEWGTARDDAPAGTPETILAVIGTLVGLELLGVAEITTVAPPQGRAGSPVTPPPPRSWRPWRSNARRPCASGRSAMASGRTTPPPPRSCSSSIMPPRQGARTTGTPPKRGANTILRGTSTPTLHRATPPLQSRPTRHAAGLAQSRCLRA